MAKGVIDQRSLCDSCEGGMVYKAGVERRVWCSFSSGYVPPNIHHCSKLRPLGAAYIDGHASARVAADEGRYVKIDPREAPAQKGQYM